MKGKAAIDNSDETPAGHGLYKVSQLVVFFKKNCGDHARKKLNRFMKKQLSASRGNHNLKNDYKKRMKSFSVERKTSMYMFG